MIRKKNKKDQEVKISKRDFPVAHFSRKAQEEIIGFGIILIIIAVIAIIFISLSVNKNSNQSTEDFEVNSFLKALMEKTTVCEKNSDFVSVKDLVFECGRGFICQGENEKDSCDILNETIKNAMGDNWIVENGSSVRGYSILIYYEEGILIDRTKGIVQGEYKGAMQNYAKGSEETEVQLKIYS